LLGRREQIVAPVDECAHRLVARQRRAIAAGKNPKALVKLVESARTGKMLTRAAASSMASGMPSSRRQIFATIGALSSLSANPRSMVLSR
jgi:hypothetical protein